MLHRAINRMINKKGDLNLMGIKTYFAKAESGYPMYKAF